MEWAVGWTDPQADCSCVPEAGSLLAQLAGAHRSQAVVSTFNSGVRDTHRMPERREPGTRPFSSQVPRQPGHPHSVFAFLSDFLADILKMSIHSFNKYLWRACTKYQGRSWRQGGQKLAFRRLDGKCCVQNQWVLVQVLKLTGSVTKLSPNLSNFWFACLKNWADTHRLLVTD